MDVNVVFPFVRFSRFIIIDGGVFVGALLALFIDGIAGR